jgi:hypothetical protein
MKYERPPNAVKDDYFRAKDYEDVVAGWHDYWVPNLDRNDRMDFWHPGFMLDVKERKAPLSKRWPLPEGCTPEDAFVLDEVAVRKALEHFPGAFFLLRDGHGDRTFLARVDELLLCDRVRVNREYGDTKRGKLIVNMSQFRQLEDPATELLPTILADLTALSWKQAPCLFPTGEESS